MLLSKAASKVFALCLFENARGDADAVEEITELEYLTIDTISSERQILRYRTATTGELITRELNPMQYSLMIDEGE